MLSVVTFGVLAAEEPQDSDAEGESTTATETVKPTQPEPTITPDVLGYAGYAKKLDETIYNKEMGSFYSKNSTIFKLWSPVADSVKVCIYKTGSDSEPGAQMLSANSMEYVKQFGAWYLELKGDYKNMYYTYKVNVNGKEHEVCDPNARAVGVNGDRAMIIDLRDTDPEGWSSDSFNRVSSQTDAIIWEVSVRDFSASETSGVSEANRGKYLAFTETGTTLNGTPGELSTCVDYIKRLGVNYVQINPFYDFASIDESNDQTPQYNWGYDPKNYNVPEGSYSSNPYDGRVRIKECKQMIQALHNAGIGVIMDVVYNHTYESDDSFFNQIVPDYYYRIAENGKWSNGSGCGNDVATERHMVRNFIKQSVTYWAQEYHIDGFRFDLMGLMDVETMNQIRSSLDTLPNGDKILMYGEAWNLETACDSSVKLANQSNMNLLSKRIGAFNDTARDAIKGSVFNATEKGFVQDGSSKAGVKEGIEAQSSGGWASVPAQCVNYVSCHDNLTLYDKLTFSVYNDAKFDTRREDLVKMNRLAGALVLSSRGTAFMLAGEEMGRTKFGDENSYKSSVEINQIDWNNLYQYYSLTDYYAGLTRIRRATRVFSDPDGKQTKLEYLPDTPKKTIAYMISGGSTIKKYIAIFNADTVSSTVNLPDGDWVMLADENRAGLIKLADVKGSVELPPTSCMVLVDAQSAPNILRDSDAEVLYVRYINHKDKSVISEQKLTGKDGETYTINPPEHIQFNYDISTSSELLTGMFSSDYAVMEIECVPYEGKFSSITFRFVDEEGKDIANSVITTNRIGQAYTTPYIPGIEGYSLDLNALPENGAGKHIKENQVVIYRYLPADSNEALDEDYTCKANIIYMGNNGEILETKSYMGINGDPVEITQFEFENYNYLSSSDDAPVFSPVEVNVVLNYRSNNMWLLKYVFIAGGVILLIGVLSIALKVVGKRRKISAMDIEE